eukprot:SAG31_NODE_1735_length_7410_cov_2.762960_4_plen_324_part_00
MASARAARAAEVAALEKLASFQNLGASTPTTAASFARGPHDRSPGEDESTGVRLVTAFSAGGEEPLQSAGGCPSNSMRQSGQPEINFESTSHTLSALGTTAPRERDPIPQQNDVPVSHWLGTGDLQPPPLLEDPKAKKKTRSVEHAADAGAAAAEGLGREEEVARDKKQAAQLGSATTLSKSVFGKESGKKKKEKTKDKERERRRGKRVKNKTSTKEGMSSDSLPLPNGVEASAATAAANASTTAGAMVLGYDTNGDGQIDSFDTNGNGSIDSRSIGSAPPKPPLWAAEQLFEAMDTNGDGVITKDEMSTALGEIYPQLPMSG